MSNGDKNNGNDDIELLPAELRRPEEKRKKEEKPEVKLFVPETEKKSPKPTFMGKFFGSKKTSETPPKTESVPKNAAEADLSVFKMQKETPRPVQPTPPAFQVSKPQTPVPSPSPKITPPSFAAAPVKPIKPTVFPKPEISPKYPPKNTSGLTKPTAPKIAPGSKLGITLIPEETTVSAKKAKRGKQVVGLILLAIVLALIGGGAYWGLKWYQDQASLELNQVEQSLSNIVEKNQALTSEKDQAQFFQKRLKALDKLLEGHIYWTNLFSFLEKNTAADVYFVNLIGGNDGQITMSGVAKSYRAMARQIVAFRAAERVDKVSVLSASATVDTEGNVTEVNFDAKLKFNPEIFLK